MLLQTRLRDLYKPYGPDFVKREPWMRTWGSDSPVFEELIITIKPKLIIEVGTWLGGSAINMARIARALQLETHIVCVDTWTGDAGAVEQNLPQPATMGGFPVAYAQFISNVLDAGLQDMITPSPQVSTLAAWMFRSWGVQAQLIYVDATHEEEDVYADCKNYWPLIDLGGVMFGDDYGCEAVQKGVERFAFKHGYPRIVVNGDKWIIHKTWA